MDISNILSKIKKRLRPFFIKYGWKGVIAVILFYLVRDLTIYVLLPYLVVRGLL